MNIQIGIPQFIMVLCGIFGVIVNIVKHGEDKGTYNAGTGFIAFVIEFLLLYWGGFFK